MNKLKTVADTFVGPTGRTFVSGNGTAGGAFWFFFSYLPGDYNQDGIVPMPRARHDSVANGDCAYLLAA